MVVFTIVTILELIYKVYLGTGGVSKLSYSLLATQWVPSNAVGDGVPTGRWDMCYM